MNKIIKEDTQELLKRYKQAKTGKELIQCVNDYFGMNELIDTFLPNEKINIPMDLLIIKGNINKVLEKEQIDINKQIYENLDILENLYYCILNEIYKYNLSLERGNFNLNEIDLDIYNDFFKNYGNMLEEFRKIIDTEHLFIIDGNDIASTINLRSINKQYMFISVNDPIYTLSSIAHEMGHIHAMNITYDNRINDYHFLLEFMSILIEDLFSDYYEIFDKEISNYKKRIKMISYYLIIREALMQIRLMKKYPDAFIKLELNPKYKEELDKMINHDYDHKRYSLYAQFYAIGFILAKNYYYQLKYTNDFNEIEKFYIEQNCKNNLSELLNNYVDMGSIKQYLYENFNQKQKKRSK